MSDSEDSDYVVEEFVRPDTIGKVATNDESDDILGNFDDEKRKKVENNIFDAEEDPFADGIDDDEKSGDSDENEENDNDGDDDEDDDDEDAEETIVAADGSVKTTTKRSADAKVAGPKAKKSKSEKKEPSAKKTAAKTGEIGEEQITALLRGVSKANRFVLYVTNLNFATSKERLAEYFSQAGAVKTVRIPKKRKGGFAFIEMADVTAFKNAFALHNTTLDERPIKVQLSEAGKKKSANKKNILKQKNRKLAEMRNETKLFSKSGKNYDKTIKKEIAKEKMQQQKMWERRKARKQNRNKKPA